jgi:acyl carrier protein
MMDLNDLKQIIEIAMDQEVPVLDMNVDLYETLGMDSIGAVAMVVEIQRHFRVRIKDEDVPNLRTPTLLLQYVNEASARVPQEMLV